jgi:hypothetical protein
MTAARLVRWISGSVNSGRSRKSSSEYRRMAMAVAADARHAGVDHGADAGHGQRGLGHVGGQHDAPPARGPEHAFLLMLRQARVQRQDLAAVRMVLAQ